MFLYDQRTTPYEGSKKIEIVEKIRKENLSFREASRLYGIPEEIFGIGIASIWKKGAKRFWWNAVAGRVLPAER